ncbi:uncharacterized protein MONBRDRAFT_38281 [Monosiga brevicollis MX1]|uniref:Uncharacterized protein n=1 Tax=Monosiga brevicollis TaxID=81824 RepID=A9V6G5_MONBE|nr:uncharacterized protein MONBRDRAFT_38281 [Monosiga brevicollis MX1]EDQ86803.1 predicted protein [Monosiga brevicollis MX1]|eukprot:XP_001748348.1 hypothetical protein [Monosiga brevicollis MX1]
MANDAAHSDDSVSSNAEPEAVPDYDTALQHPLPPHSAATPVAALLAATTASTLDDASASGTSNSNRSAGSPQRVRVQSLDRSLGVTDINERPPPLPSYEEATSRRGSINTATPASAPMALASLAAAPPSITNGTQPPAYSPYTPASITPGYSPLTVAAVSSSDQDPTHRESTV